MSKIEKTARGFRAYACSLKLGNRWRRLTQQSNRHDEKRMLGKCGCPNFDEFADAVAYVGRIIEKYGNDLSLLLFLKMNTMAAGTSWSPIVLAARGGLGPSRCKRTGFQVNAVK